VILKNQVGTFKYAHRITSLKMGSGSINRKLHIFMGKGGVGKTTMATSKAWKDAKLGKKTLLVTIMSPEVLGSLFNFNSDSERPVELLDSVPLYGLNLDPKKIARESIKGAKGFGLFKNVVLKSDFYKAAVEDAPGIPEFLSLYKLHDIFFEEDFDSVVLDAPATGHGISFLEAPGTLEGLLTGKLEKMVSTVYSLLRDDAKTHIDLVTLPEEMPVNETLHIASKLEENKLGLKYLIVNCLQEDIYKTQEDKTLFKSLGEDQQYLIRLKKNLRDAGFDPTLADTIFRNAEHYQNKADDNAHYLKKLEDHIKAPHIHIPIINDTSERLLRVREIFGGYDI